MKVYENIKEFIEKECIVGEKEKVFLDDFRYEYRKKYGYKEREFEGVSFMRLIKTYVPVTCCMYQCRVLIMGISLKNIPEILVDEKHKRKKDIYVKLDRFVREKCVISKYDSILANTLFHLFLDYCEHENDKIMNEVPFSRRLCEDHKEIDIFTRPSGKRILNGITLPGLEGKNIHRFIDEMLVVDKDKRVSFEKLRKEFYIFSGGEKNPAKYDSVQELTADIYRVFMEKNIYLEKVICHEIEDGERKTRRGFAGIGFKETNA